MSDIDYEALEEKTWKEIVENFQWMEEYKKLPNRKIELISEAEATELLDYEILAGYINYAISNEFLIKAYNNYCNLLMNGDTEDIRRIDDIALSEYGGYISKKERIGFKYVEKCRKFFVEYFKEHGRIHKGLVVDFSLVERFVNI